MVAQPQASLPRWEDEARFRDQQLGSITFDNGASGPRPIVLRRSGYLERLRVVFTTLSTYITAGPTGVDAFGQHSGPLKRMTIRAGAIGTLFDCTGYMTAVIGALDAQYNYGANFSLILDPYAFTVTPALAATTNIFAYEIPIGCYLANKPYPVGLFLTAINGLECTAEAVFNPVGGSAGAPGTCLYTGNPGNQQTPTGTMHLQQQYYDPIKPESAQPYLGWISRWRDFIVQMSADGDISIPLTPGNHYGRMILAVVTGGAAALALDVNHVNYIQLIYGGANMPINETRQQILSRQSRQYGAALPVGVFVIDLLEKTHTDRDAFNSRNATDLRLIVNITGATYTGGAYILCAVQEFVELDVRNYSSPQ